MRPLKIQNGQIHAYRGACADSESFVRGSNFEDFFLS